MIVQRSRLLLFRVLRHFVPRSTLSSSSKMANEAEQKNLKPFPHFGTLAIHAGQEPEQWNSRAVVPPISMATTFKQDDPGVHRVSFLSYLTWKIRNDQRCCTSDLSASSRDSNIRGRGTLPGTALRLAWRLWRVPSMVRKYSLSSPREPHAFPFG